MTYSPLLIVHICAGTIGVLSGFAAMSFRKGSQRHRVTGNVFVISMLSLGASGAYLGLMKHQFLNAMMGTLTFYLVATAWWTARRRDGAVGIFDWAALLVPLTVGTALVTNGLVTVNSQTGSKNGDPAAAYFVFGSIALLFAAGDVRMLVRRGISGTQRIARHLGRMCLAWFIASGSIFLARPHLFPVFLRTTGMLYLLSFLPLILMVFWLVRIRFKKASQRKAMPRSAEAYSLRT